MNLLRYPVLGMNRKTNLLALATHLRQSGKSYSEIHKEIGVPKSTLSNWFVNKKWSQQVKRKLQIKWSEIDTNRLIKINKNRRFITLIKYARYRKEATESFQKLVGLPLFLIGLSLYWGEGQKIENGVVGLINSDVNLLKTIVSFYRKILKVPEEKLRVALFVYKDNNLDKALNFWSKNLMIPRSQFIKTQVLPSRAKLTKRKVKHGICNIYFSNTEFNIKIQQWIKLLARKQV